jgi:hypothetical protein
MERMEPMEQTVLMELMALMLLFIQPALVLILRAV